MTDEVNPVEVQAREMGWVPQAEFQGEPTKWVPAEKWVDRAPLFEKIDDMRRHSRNLEYKLNQAVQTINDFSRHHQTYKADEQKRILAALRAQKKEALESQEFVRAEEIQERIEEVKETPVVTPNVVTNEPPPHFVEWVEKNTWYNENKEMRDFADAIGMVEAKNGLPPEQVLVNVTAKVKKAYPDKFKNPMKKEAPALEPNPGTGVPGNVSGWKPSEHHERIGKRFVEQGLYKNVNEYYEELRAHLKVVGE